MFGTILTSTITSLFTAVITGIITFNLQEKKLKTELKTEFMAEQAIKKLLENHNWKKRSFKALKDRIGGFEDDELRKILVRAGAVKFRDSNNDELWGLIDKNINDI